MPKGQTSRPATKPERQAAKRIKLSAKAGVKTRQKDINTIANRRTKNDNRQIGAKVGAGAKKDYERRERHRNPRQRSTGLKTKLK